MKSPKPKFDRILVATDFSASAEAALKQAAWLARTNRAELSLVHVLPDLRNSPRSMSGPKMQRLLELAYGEGEDFKEFSAAMESQTLAELRKSVSKVDADDLHVECRVLGGEMIVELVHEIRAKKIDLVMTGTRGNSGWEQFFIGSNSARAIRQCPTCVWIVKESDRRPPNLVLSAIDFSAASVNATNRALFIAKQANAEFHLLHVVDSMDIPEDAISKIPRGSSLRDEIHEEAEKHLDDFVVTLDVDPASIKKHVRWGTPWKEISRLAEQLEADLIAMGTVGRSGIVGLLLGNTAEKVLGVCNCSILTSKPDNFVSPIA